MEKPNTIELKSIARIRGFERAIAANQLSKACYLTPRLSRELPIPSEKYSNPFSAYRRLGYIANKEREFEIAAYAIKESRMEIGIATVEPGEPRPNTLKTYDAAEISYWHSYVSTKVAVEYGKIVVDEAIKRSRIITALKRVDTLWMVTLPDDDMKARVMDETGFYKVGEPRHYDIRDQVIEDRQLWARET